MTKIKSVKTASAKVTKEWYAVQAEVRKHASKPNSRAYKAAFKALRQMSAKLYSDAKNA